jgi:hypothetical protein
MSCATICKLTALFDVITLIKAMPHREYEMRRKKKFGVGLGVVMVV